MKKVFRISVTAAALFGAGPAFAQRGFPETQVAENGSGARADVTHASHGGEVDDADQRSLNIRVEPRPERLRPVRIPPEEQVNRSSDRRETVSRIPLVEIADLTPEQRDAYENRPGGKLKLNRLLAHAVTIQPGISLAVKGMMTGIEVPPLERQICVLAALHLDRGAYEWAQHLQVSKAMGITDAKVEAIADDRFGDPVFDERERALLAFTRQVVKTVRVDDFVFDEVASFYSPRQIVELVHVIGLYMLFARVSEVAELEIDAVAGGQFWKEANQEAGLAE